jgi:hypothetical protein
MFGKMKIFLEIVSIDLKELLNKYKNLKLMKPLKTWIKGSKRSKNQKRKVKNNLKLFVKVLVILK